MDLTGRRQSENVHRQIVPMLSGPNWLDPIMATQAGLSAALHEILRPTLGPKPAVSKAMEDAAYRDRLQARSQARQRAMPEPSFAPSPAEIGVRAAAIVAEQVQADFQRQTAAKAPKPRRRGWRSN